MDATHDNNTPKQPVEPSKRSYGNNKGLMQAYVLRDTASEQVLALREEQPTCLKEKQVLARALRDLGMVWKEATERIRILRGRPLPGSLRPQGAKKRRKVQQGPLFTELPADPQTPPDTV
jgi:hypothetical protein